MATSRRLQTLLVLGSALAFTAGVIGQPSAAHARLPSKAAIRAIAAQGVGKLKRGAAVAALATIAVSGITLVGAHHEQQVLKGKAREVAEQQSVLAERARFLPGMMRVAVQVRDAEQRTHDLVKAQLEATERATATH